MILVPSGSERVLPSHIWRQELSHHRHEAQKKRNVCQSSVFFLRTKRRTENEPAAVRKRRTRAAASPNAAPTSPHDEVRCRFASGWTAVCQEPATWGMRVSHTQRESCESTASAQGQTSAWRKTAQTQSYCGWKVTITLQKTWWSHFMIFIYRKNEIKFNKFSKKVKCLSQKSEIFYWFNKKLRVYFKKKCKCIKLSYKTTTGLSMERITRHYMNNVTYNGSTLILYMSN